MAGTMAYLLVLSLVFTMGISAAVPAAALADLSGDGELDQEIALGLYDYDPVSEDEKFAEIAMEASAFAGPLAEAGSKNFAEALAQEYYPDQLLNDDSGAAEKAVKTYFRLTPAARFYIVSNEVPEEDLVSTVRLMASQFAAYSLPSSEPLRIVYGPEKLAQQGDIVISLLKEEDFSGIRDVDIRQAYKFDVAERIDLRACSTDGIYYGLISLMEIAFEKKTEDAAGITLPYMHISDAPDIKERTVFLDCGRKYFSKEWIENFIRRSSLQRYNAIVLHFSEAEGLRLDSRTFPWLTEGIRSLSMDEMTEIVNYAKMYHMKVVPSIDVPGHNMYMVKKYEKYVKKHPDFSFAYGGITYDRSVKGFGTIANHYSRDGVTLKVTDIGIDITKPHAVAFADALIDDYAEFFRSLGCTDFDICGDEVMGWSHFMLGDNEVSYKNRWLFLEHWRKYARDTLGISKGSASDTFINYLNTVCGRLGEMGYTCRVFNDEIDINKDQHLELNKDIGVVCWDLQHNGASHYAKNGHTVYNCVMQWCYYVVRTQGGKDIMKKRYKTVNARNIFENYDPRSFSAKASKKRHVRSSKLGGAYFCIWCDNPDYKTDRVIWKETELRTWANASRMWNPEVNSDESGIKAAIRYKSLKRFVTDLNGFPGYGGDPAKKSVLPEAGYPEPAE